MAPVLLNDFKDVLMTHVQRVCPPQEGFAQLVFDAHDLEILQSSTACLNDTCINGCIPLLFSSIQSVHAHRFAVLSTHDLIRIRYNADDHGLWRAMKHTLFWSKDIWVIPIHRPDPVGHWVLCIAQLAHCELLLFDSFGERQGWRANVQVFHSSHWLAHFATIILGNHDAYHPAQTNCPRTRS